MSRFKDFESIREMFQEGNEVDGFLIGEPIHKGGMAALYQGTKEGIDYPILVKVPRTGRDQPVESLIGFETELNIMKANKSAYVPRVAGTDNVAKKPYIAMEHLGGIHYIRLLKKMVANLLTLKRQFRLFLTSLLQSPHYMHKTLFI